MLETCKGSCVAVLLFVSICGTHLQAGRSYSWEFHRKDRAFSQIITNKP